MPDRELTPKELKEFIEEHETENIFNALDVFQGEKTKPSLHDLCILELQAKTDGLQLIIIQMGRELKLLKKEES